MKHSPKHGPQSPQLHNHYENHDEAAPPTQDHLVEIKLRKQKARTRRRRVWVWAQTLSFALASLLLMGALFSVHTEYRKWQARVSKRAEELAALKTQLAVGQKRLAALQSPQGHKQLLIENGFLRPGDRILEFPTNAEETRQAALPPNDLAPHADEWGSSASSSGSMWRSAWNSLQERWSSWRRQGKPPQIAAVPN